MGANVIRGIDRRRFLATGAAAVIGAGVAARATALSPADVPPGGVMRSKAPLPRPYQVPLPIPAAPSPLQSAGGTDTFQIVQREAKLEILPGLRTSCWTYNGTFPGPTIISRSGRRTIVRHRNELPQPTVVHLHGGHTPSESDGYPIDLTMPVNGRLSVEDAMAGMDDMGETHGNIAYGERTYTYPMQQRASTMWYHDHRMGYTGTAVWHGLAGFHLVTDDEDDALALPRGDRDIPLMIADRAFEADGSLMYPGDPGMHSPGVSRNHTAGVQGDVILVNGVPWPVHQVQRGRYRLRLLNASNVRYFKLVLDPPPPGGKGLVQIGSDGGLMERPLPHDSLRLAPGERFDVVVDFSRYRPGTKVRVVNLFGSRTTADIMRFDISPSTRAVRDDTRVPDRLARRAESVLDPAKAVATRTFEFRHSGRKGWTINGQPYRPGRSLARTKLGTTEIWRFRSVFFHSIHVHLDPFRVVSRNGKAPGPFDQGWKDTIAMGPGETVEVAVHFTDYAGHFMLHCHNLEHEDMAMMADFSTY